MNKIPLISIIVPAYNAEAWIEDCCESVFSQTYENWELIIVNDGSTDYTGRILEDISSRCQKLKIVHTENGGVSRARNTGLDMANGDYMMFLDADDLLVVDALETMVKEIEQHPCDIVIGWKTNIDINLKEKGCPYKRESTFWTGKKALEMSLRDHPAAYAVWGKLYKKELLENIRFAEGRKVHEDSFFLFQCFCQMPDVRLIDQVVLKYRISPKSASRSEFSDKFLDILYFAEEKRRITGKYFPEFMELAENVYVKANMALLKNLHKTDDKQYRDLEKQCVENVIANKNYFLPAIPEDKKWYWMITHRMYDPYKYMKKIVKNKMLVNVSWLMAGKVIHMILGFLLSLITARYLGPGNYGLINYASAYTTFFTSLCTLGISSIIVKNMIDKPEEEGESLGTTIVLRLIASFLSIGVIAGIVRMIDGNEPITLMVVTLYSISLIFQSFDIFRQWFQAKLLSKYYAITTLISYLIASAYKILLLIIGKSVEWFAVANSLDYLIVAGMLYVFYRKSKGSPLRFSMKKAKELLSISYNYILSGMMIAVYAATDKFMLKHFLDSEAVGYYALAVSLSSLWTFVLSAVIESVFPSIMRNHNTDKGKYEKSNKQLYAIVFYLSVFASLSICVLAPFIIGVLYGKQYLPSVGPLRIVVWYVTFSYLGVAREAWVVCEKKQKYLKYLYLGSAVCNVIMNAWLIPVWGTNGAAFASVFTQFSTIFIMPLFIKDFRSNVRMMVEAIMLKGILRR